MHCLMHAPGGEWTPLVDMAGGPKWQRESARQAVFRLRAEGLVETGYVERDYGPRTLKLLAVRLPEAIRHGLDHRARLRDRLDALMADKW